MGRAVAAFVLALTMLPLYVRADDSGPARTIRQVRFEARRLLARAARAAGIDPKTIAISDVVANDNQALLSWDFGKEHGIMGLTRQDDRWWDALDGTFSGGCWNFAKTYPLEADVPPAGQETLIDAGVRAHAPLCHAAPPPITPDVRLRSEGATITPPRVQTSGYALTLRYAPNNAASAAIKQVYFRPPTPAEFLPNHPFAPGWGGADAVCYFDIAIGANTPVTFKPGTTIDVWFPFVLDDQLEYTMNVSSGEGPLGPVKASIFDNTLHFVLPDFMLSPDKPLMAEIDGDPKPSH